MGLAIAIGIGLIALAIAIVMLFGALEYLVRFGRYLLRLFTDNLSAARTRYSEDRKKRSEQYLH